MGSIKLLDCTLRDGGYVNNWEFGVDAISDMAQKLQATNVDILELGFLKNEKYNKNRTVFNDVEQISTLIPKKKKDILYAAMIEVVNPIPLEMLNRRKCDDIDVIRVIIWKTRLDSNGNVVDALNEGYEYCKGIIEKGYQLCVQPARVDQYTDTEFIEMLNIFQQLNPMAIYIVDSWGTQNSEGVLHYLKLADKYLRQGIGIGYHGHNNLMQAFGSSLNFIQAGVGRDLIVDASIYGIGRGAGNLNLELIASYLNEEVGKEYSIEPMLEIYERYIKKIFAGTPWGYSMAFFLTAQYRCNPDYGSYYCTELKLTIPQIKKIFSNMTEEDKIIFSKDKAKNLYNELITP